MIIINLNTTSQQTYKLIQKSRLIVEISQVTRYKVILIMKTVPISLKISPSIKTSKLLNLRILTRKIFHHSIINKVVCGLLKFQSLKNLLSHRLRKARAKHLQDKHLLKLVLNLVSKNNWKISNKNRNSHKCCSKSNKRQ